MSRLWHHTRIAAIALCIGVVIMLPAERAARKAHAGQGRAHRRKATP